MKAWNATRDRTLVDNGRVATNLWTRGRGLLGTKSLPTGDGLLILPCNGIHSFFMQYPFDAVFLDKTGYAVHLIRSMKPQRLSKIVFSGHSVLELPAGTIEQTLTQLGDEIRWDESTSPST